MDWKVNYRSQYPEFESEESTRRESGSVFVYSVG